MSPGDERIAFVGMDAEGESAIYVRETNGLQQKRLPGTESAAAPFFSPDGRWIGFFSGMTLKKISAEGGAPIELCGADGLVGAYWSNDGFIYASRSFRAGVSRVAETGGQPSELTKPGELTRAHRWPHVLEKDRILL